MHRSLLNREISEYPTNVIPKNDARYVKEYKKVILFDVNVSEYRDIISSAVSKSFDTYRAGVQVSGDATPDDLLKTIRTKIMTLYKVKISPHNSDNKLVTKIEGYSDYLLGDTPLKDFRRIT